MPNFAGSMLQRVQDDIKSGGKIAVIVVDEQASGVYDETYKQRQVLAFATAHKLPIFLVELNPNPSQPTIPTTVHLRTLVPPGTTRLSKTGFNAFHGTELKALLDKADVDTIVLMGFATNMCVRMTAVGGYTGRNNTGEHTLGATQLGLSVMTCQDILRGGPASWSGEVGVELYSAV
jgi:hypothetical protein